MCLSGIHADPILVFPQAEFALTGLALLEKAALLKGSFIGGGHSEGRGGGEREEESAEEAHDGV